MTIIKPLNSSC